MKAFIKSPFRELVKKCLEKVCPYFKPPSNPQFVLFSKKKYPHFLLENASLMAKTNFTFGPMKNLKFE